MESSPDDEGIFFTGKRIFFEYYRLAAAIDRIIIVNNAEFSAGERKIFIRIENTHAYE